MKKEIVIFVPGALNLPKWPTIIQDICFLFDNLFKIKPCLDDHVAVWKERSFFKKPNFIWMHWKRGIGPISKFFAKRELRRLLHCYQNENVKLIGISLGGDIILKTLKKNRYSNIKKIILVGSINEIKNINFEHPQIINIFSDKDKFAQIAIEVYFPIHGGERLFGKNVVNMLC